MNAAEQLSYCGRSTPFTETELIYIEAQCSRHALVGHGRKQRVQRQMCKVLGLSRWPGRAVLTAVVAGESYVSPSDAGIVLHTVFNGDADAYHGSQV